MKAISLKQPWAWLMAQGFKMPEFRNRRDSFRGECYIHASKQIDKAAFEWMTNHLPRPYINEIAPDGVWPLGMFNTGKIIGKFTITDCMTVETAKLKYPNDIWLQVAGTSLGKVAFITESPVQFPPYEQFEYKGTIFPLFFEVHLPTPILDESSCSSGIGVNK